MNWKLIGQVSLLGLVIGVGTISLIPPNWAPWHWIALFLVSAYFIAARTTSRRFQHGLMVGLANTVWITGSHILFAETYVAHHAGDAAMMQRLPVHLPTRVMMAVVGPLFGVVTGCIIGLLAVIVGKLVPKR